MTQLETWMTQNHETDESLAAKADVSRVQISRLRRGINRPRPALASRLEKITSIPAAEFIFGAAA